MMIRIICRFCSCAFFSNVYSKINFMAKMGLTYAISIVNLMFGIFLSFFFFFFFFLPFLHLFYLEVIGKKFRNFEQVN